MGTVPPPHQRRVAFDTQAKLFAWISCNSDTDLRKVRMLTLQLTDVDLAAIFDVAPKAQQGSTLKTWSLYQNELEALAKALRCLPGLTDVVVVAPEQKHSQLLKGMYLSFLALIPERLTRIKRLTIHDANEHVVEKMPTLSKIPQVILTGSNQAINNSSTPSKSLPTQHLRDASKVEGESLIKVERMDIDSL